MYIYSVVLIVIVVIIDRVEFLFVYFIILCNVLYIDFKVKFSGWCLNEVYVLWFWFFSFKVWVICKLDIVI